MNSQSREQASYTLGYELGRALVLEARHQLMRRAEQRQREQGEATGSATPVSDAARALHTLTATSRLIRRIVWRSRRAMANANLRGDQDAAAWHFGHIDGARSVLL